jgi:Calcineurin-like phosphoesterase
MTSATHSAPGPRAGIGLALLSALAGCAAPAVPAGPAPDAPAADQVASSVFLIGDAGAPARSGEPVLQALHRELAGAPDSSIVLFLGDNVYPHGLPAPSAAVRAEAERRLAAQREATRVGTVRTIFLPGNHDWDKSGPGGLAAIRRQGQFLAATGEGRAELLPAGGCPGPVVVDIGGFRLILLDTEWWLYSGSRPGPEDGCDPGTPKGVLDRLSAAIDSAAGRPVIVAAHHPLASGGEHGGHFTLVDHLFPLRAIHPALWLPLPVIGSAYPIARAAGVSDEDLSGGRYRRLRAALDSVFACRPPMIYAAGHEHALQVIDRGAAPLLLVSGAGIVGHEGHVARIAGSRVARSDAGFMRVDRLYDGRVRVRVIVVDGTGNAREVHSEWLTPPAAGEAGCSH